MNRVHFELDRDGVRELLRSADMTAMLEAEAKARCPSGCSVNTYTGKNRANAEIITETAEAYRANLERNTLLKALGQRS